MDLLGPDELEAYVKKEGIAAEVMRDVGETPTVTTAAAALGVEPDQVLKTLLFTVEGSQLAPAGLCIVISHGEKKVKQNLLSKHFWVSRKKVKFAPAEAVLDIVGYIPGGVPPFGHKTQDIPVILDKSVVDYANSVSNTVYGGGGDKSSMLKITCDELCRVVPLTVLPLSGDGEAEATSNTAT